MNVRAGLWCVRSTPLPDILVTRMRSFRPRSVCVCVWGGGEGGDLQDREEFAVNSHNQMIKLKQKRQQFQKMYFHTLLYVL